MILQTDVQTGKTYRHKLLENGDKIDYVVLFKPNDELCKQYEASKDKYLDDLYNTLEDKEKKTKVTIVKDLKRLQLTEKQQLVLNYSNSGLEVKDIYKKVGVSQARVYKILADANKKQALLKKMEQMAKDKEVIE
jgi:DNA-directed RNA polymerase specialized sigma subunit